jgi:predicted O-methyltransferase YrrM
VLSESNSVLSESAHTNDVIDLMYKLMEYRNQEIRHRLEKVGRAASMLHLDVLLLIYHFAKFGTGNILEIGSYIGSSTIAAAFGARDSRNRAEQRKIIKVINGVPFGPGQSAGFFKKRLATLKLKFFLF